MLRRARDVPPPLRGWKRQPRTIVREFAAAPPTRPWRLSSTTTHVEGEDVLLGRLEQVSHPAAAPERGHLGREGLCLVDVEIGHRGGRWHPHFAGAFPEATDGIRTHDLLRGKKNSRRL